MTRDTIVINLFAGSGAGKSTNSARLFTMFKESCNNIEVELITEYAKDLVWEERNKTFKCQPYIFGKQLNRLERVIGSVDVAVTDSPLLLSAIYDSKKCPYLEKLVVHEFKRFNNMNFFLDRVVPFSPIGRNEKSLEEAVENDKRLLEFLQRYNIPFTHVTGNADGCKTIFSQAIVKMFEKRYYETFTTESEKQK